jgi:hypothetical protein
MPEYTVVDIREETPAEAARREWFEKQALAAPDNLEAAARQIIGLVTALLGVLFGVLTVAGDPLPGYMQLLIIRWLGIAVVVSLLLALLTSLLVILPFKRETASGKPDSQERVFREILNFKSYFLFWGAVLFGIGLLALGIILIIAIWLA